MHNIRKCSRVLICLLMMLIILIGCSGKEYEEFSTEFTKVYLDVADSIDIEDTLKSLENLQSPQNKDNIDKMKTLLENIRDKVPEDKREHFQMLNDWYNGITVLRNAHGKWDEMSIEEKRHVTTEIGLVNIRKK